LRPCPAIRVDRQLRSSTPTHGGDLLRGPRLVPRPPAWSSNDHLPSFTGTYVAAMAPAERRIPALEARWSPIDQAPPERPPGNPGCGRKPGRNRRIGQSAITRDADGSERGGEPARTGANEAEAASARAVDGPVLADRSRTARTAAARRGELPTRSRRVRPATPRSSSRRRPCRRRSS
jgi:hypothetical protein